MFPSYLNLIEKCLRISTPGSDKNMRIIIEDSEYRDSVWNMIILEYNMNLANSEKA